MLNNNPNNNTKLNFAETLAKYGLTVPACGHAPGVLQVFYGHGGLSFNQAMSLFGDLADYAIDGSGSGPSLFLRLKNTV